MSARRVALVTGGSGAIGGAIASTLSALGYVVAVHYHKNTAAADALICSLRGRGQIASAYSANLTDSDAPSRLVEAVTHDCGTVDVLVNAAGLTLHSLLGSSRDADITDVIALNLVSAMRMTRAVAPMMMRQRRGSIVNLSSVASVRPLPGHTAYVASKSGIEGFTVAAATELGPKGIRVNAVAPGIIASPMTQDLRDRTGSGLLNWVALRRFGTPTDVAEAVAYLASDSSSFVTGHVLRVDGGARYDLGSRG